MIHNKRRCLRYPLLSPVGFWKYKHTCSQTTRPSSKDRTIRGSYLVPEAKSIALSVYGVPKYKMVVTKSSRPGTPTTVSLFSFCSHPLYPHKIYASMNSNWCMIYATHISLSTQLRPFSTSGKNKDNLCIQWECNKGGNHCTPHQHRKLVTALKVQNKHAEFH